MENNNWKEIAEKILDKYISHPYLSEEKEVEVVNAMLNAMNLVFEASKKEFLDKVELVEYMRSNGDLIPDKFNIENDFYINKDSIESIEKPNL